MLRILATVILLAFSTQTHAAVLVDSTMNVNFLSGSFSGGGPSVNSGDTSAFLAVDLSGMSQTMPSTAPSDSLTVNESSSSATASFQKSGTLLVLGGVNGTTQGTISIGGSDMFGGESLSRLTTTESFTLTNDQDFTVSFSSTWNRSTSDATMGNAETSFSVSLMADGGTGVNLLDGLNTTVQSTIDGANAGSQNFSDTVSLSAGTYSFESQQTSRSTAVPEPSSVVALGFLLVGAAVARRRRRSRPATT